MRARSTLPFLMLLAARGLAGCSSDDQATTITIVTSPGVTNPFTASSKCGPVTTVALTVRDTTGVETPVATAPVGQLTIDLPAANQTGLGSLEIYGYNASNATCVVGGTPLFDLTSLQGSTVPLAIFTQEVDSIAAIPQPQGTASLPPVETQPLVQILGIQYVVVANSGGPSVVGLDGSNEYQSLDFLDLVTWNSSHYAGFFKGASNAFTTPKTLIAVGEAILAIDANGVAVAVDSSSATDVVSVDPPSGLTSFAPFAGATVIQGDDGSAYLLAGTGSAPSGNGMLIVADDGSLSSIDVSGAPISGTALWGGTTLGILVLPSTPGAILSISVPDSTNGITGGTVTPLAATASTPAGAIVVATDATHLVEIDPSGQVSTIDLACKASCAPTVASVSLAQVSATPYDVAVPMLGGDLAVVRGNSLTRVDAALTSATPVMANFAQATTAIGLPTGQVLLTSGAGSSLATYAPPR